MGSLVRAGQKQQCSDQSPHHHHLEEIELGASMIVISGEGELGSDGGDFGGEVVRG